jgi:hypothetical protein
VTFTYMLTIYIILIYSLHHDPLHPHVLFFYFHTWLHISIIFTFLHSFPISCPFQLVPTPRQESFYLLVLCFWKKTFGLFKIPTQGVPLLNFHTYVYTYIYIYIYIYICMYMYVCVHYIPNWFICSISLLSTLVPLLQWFQQV